MKKVLAIALASALLIAASFSLYGCAENKTEPAPSVTETETEEKEILEIHHLIVEPDYEYQLYLSDDVILGEVIEELESGYTNPNRTKDIINAWQTKYVVRVDKSYKNVLKEGEEIEVITWNRIGLYPEDEENYQIENDEEEFYLKKGQHGVFMLNYDERDKLYDIVYEKEGIFEPMESGVALINEDAAEVYASPSFEITLDQIPADIERADEKFGDRYETPVNGGGIFVDESQSNEVE